jgi:hypothetical protein
MQGWPREEAMLAKSAIAMGFAILALTVWAPPGFAQAKYSDEHGNDAPALEKIRPLAE